VVDAPPFGVVAAADVTRTAVNDHRGLPLVTGLAGPATPSSTGLPISQGNSGLPKITRNLILDFATFAWTGQSREAARGGLKSLSCATEGCEEWAADVDFAM